MKRKFERFGEKLTPQEDENVWNQLQGALQERQRRNNHLGSNSRTPSGTLQVVFAFAMALLLVFIWQSRQNEPVVQKQFAAIDSLEQTITPVETEPQAVGVLKEPEARTDTTPAARDDSTNTAPEKSESEPLYALELPPGTGTISGIVTGDVHGMPLEGVNVMFDAHTWGTCTDESGCFTITNVPPGTYDLTFSHVSYEKKQIASVIVEAGDLAYHKIALEEKVVVTLAALKVTAKRKKIDKVCSATSRKSVSQGGQPTHRGGRKGNTNQARVTPMPSKKSKTKQIYVPPPEPTQSATTSNHLPHDCFVILQTPPSQPPAQYPSGTGGTYPVNGQLADDMFFRHEGTNPFTAADEDNLSTFALDVDTGSYTMMRSYLTKNALPPAAAVRVEEFINYFDKPYHPPESGDFTIQTDEMPSPFAHAQDAGYRILRIGIRGRDINNVDRPPIQIALVVDTSGSMNDNNRIALVKQSIKLLIDQLNPNDEICIVRYGVTASEVMAHTAASKIKDLQLVLNRLHPHGGTNVGAGLLLGYDLLRQVAKEGWDQRVILFSDGVANTGRTNFDDILVSIRDESERITLTTIGFGMGNYNDTLMEQLADAGDGQYAYVDDIKEAKRVLAENLTGMLHLIAREAKAQIEFDADCVVRYRLLGYENRDIKDRDFRNNAVDAGEIGAGHEVTALYEIKLSNPGGGDPAATVRLRYEKPEGSEFNEIEKPIQFEANPDIAAAPADLIFDACVAEYAEILRNSFWAKESSFCDVLSLLHTLPGEFKEKEDVAEFIQLVAKASILKDK
jgi:Ca-activated chloride channel homolog